MIRELSETVGDAIVESVGRAVGRSQEQRPLPVDLLESDDAYLAVFDAPGVESADVQVRFEGNTVYARVDRFREFYEDYEMRFPGRGLSLDGSVTLPDDAAVDPTGATATLKANGTLQVEIPKVAEDAETTVAVTDEAAEAEGHETDEEEADDHEPDGDEADTDTDTTGDDTAESEADDTEDS